MTTDRETLRAIADWLEDGRTALPDHVLDAVLAQLPSKPQRRPVWTARRMPRMNAFAKYAVGVAAVVAIAFLGLSVLGTPRTGEPGGTSPVPSRPGDPSPGASASPVPHVPANGALDAGRYRWKWWPDGAVTFEVGEGWSARTDGSIVRNANTDAEIDFAQNLPGSTYEVTHVYADACASEGTLEPVEGTARDLVDALDAQAGTDVRIEQVTADLVVGYRVEIRQAANLPDRAGCRYGAQGPLQVWANEFESSFFALAVEVRGVVYVFDVGGQRVVFASAHRPHTPISDIAKVDAMVASLDFRPPEQRADLRLPGTMASPAGVYGFEGGDGYRTGMHKVRDGESAELVFTVGPDCMAADQAQRAQPVRVAGLEGIVVQPHEPPVVFVGGDGTLVTRAYRLDVDTQRLCVFLTRHPTTTEAGWATALSIIDTIRAEVVDGNVRVTFTLDEGWDVG